MNNDVIEFSSFSAAVIFAEFSTLYLVQKRTNSKETNAILTLNSKLDMIILPFHSSVTEQCLLFPN